MFRSVARNSTSKYSFALARGNKAPLFQIRGMASKQPIEDVAQMAGEKKKSSPEDPSIVSSGGAIGKQFNPDGNVGQIGEKIGGPFSKDGVIGSQFDASKDGLAGQVEKAVDGPSRPATESDPKKVKVNTDTSVGAQR